MEEPTLLLLDDPMSRIDVGEDDELRGVAEDVVEQLKEVIKAAQSESGEDDSVEEGADKTTQEEPRSAASSPGGEGSHRL